VIGAWVMLAVGAVMFLRAATQTSDTEAATIGRRVVRTKTVGEVVLVGSLVALPAASDAIAQSFHPQDLVSVGLACAALACALRRRWAAVGVLFAAAFLCKQFALLALFVAVAAAPGWRARVRILLPFGAGVALGVLPFYLVDRVHTLRALTGVYVAGAGVVKTPTFVGLLGIVEQTKIEIARDAPLALAAVLCVWAWWWARERLLAPLPLVGLALACMASRLVFEIAILNYYWLAVGVFFLLLDAVHRRPPILSIAWIVCSRYGLGWMVTTGMPSSSVATAFGALSLAPLIAGLAEVTPVRRVAPTVPAPPRAPVRLAAVVAEPALWISAPGAPAGAGSGRQ
jgi:hypothetical protein